MKLYEIKSRFIEMLESLNNDYNFETGELVEDESLKEQILEEIKKELKEKAENIIKYIKIQESNKNEIDNEIKRLEKIKKSQEKSMEFLKKYVLESLEVLKEQKINTAIGNISIRKSQKVIVDEENIDKSYLVVKKIATPDKIKIKEDLKNGILIKGAYLQENKNLVVK